MIADWALPREKRRVQAYVCSVVVCVFSLMSYLLVTVPASALDWTYFGVLVVLGLAQSEIGRSVERIRRRMTKYGFINTTSVWTFAAALLLPVWLSSLLVMILYAHLRWRSSYRFRKIAMWRIVLSISMVSMLCFIAHAVADIGDVTSGSLRSSALMLAAMALYFIVGALIVLPARSEIEWTWRGLFGSAADNALELVTLCLGLFTAVVLTAAPVAVIAVVPPMAMLHRTVLVRQLETDVVTDPKTQVLNSAGWYQRAEQLQVRADRASMLMIDIDRFKSVNDTFGHLAGDEVLREIATTIKRHVRECDVVGRFGGEEFVVFLPDVSVDVAVTVGERIRRAVEAVQVPIDTKGGPLVIEGLTVSVGLASHPHDAKSLQTLIDAADRAVYEAKRAGRNRVARHSADSPRR